MDYLNMNMKLKLNCHCETEQKIKTKNKSETKSKRGLTKLKNWIYSILYSFIVIALLKILLNN